MGRTKCVTDNRCEWAIGLPVVKYSVIMNGWCISIQ